MAVVRAKAIAPVLIEDALRRLPAIEAARNLDLGEAHLAMRLSGRPDIPATIVLPPSPSGFPAVLSLASLNGANGFRLDGIDIYDSNGRSVASAGDVNGDGFADIITGADGGDPGDPGAGESYVIFGKAGGFAAGLDLATVNGANGFRIDGVNVNDFSGRSVASAGDINGDGFDDIIIGASFADPGGINAAGQSYVIYGKASGFSASFDLAAVNGANGFRIDGIDADDRSGHSVASAGDVNGDGFDDFLVGAPFADPNGDSNAGETYVVFGQAGSFGVLALASLNGTNGFRIDGIDLGDVSGYSVASAGDVNGDGFDDIIVGASAADPNGDSYAGESYVVFGKASGFAASLDLATLNGTNGFRIDGIGVQDASGVSVASAGDINGDGFADVIIGNNENILGGPDIPAGESYVVFGKAGGFAASLDLAALNGANGFRIDGAAIYDQAGRSVSSAGDINGDGFDDFLVGAPSAGAAGATYVVFGKAGGFSASLDLAIIDGINGFRVDGIDDGDISGRSVSAAGDVNGDGFADIIIGAHYADPGGDLNAGESYVVFGRAPTASVVRTGSVIAQMISGGIGDDTLSGMDDADTLRGVGGDDVLLGGAGSDSADGGNGDDTIEGGSGNDRLIGGNDFDLVAGGSGNDTLTGSLGEDTLNGGSGTDTVAFVFGTKLDLTTPSANTSEAIGDVYISIEKFLGSTGSDKLFGGTLADDFNGGSGRDQLDGRGGDDLLEGGLGRDTLTGGAGDDRFVLSSSLTAHRDTIADFTAGDDIALKGSVFGLATGALAASAFKTGSAATDGDDRIVYNPANGKLFFDADGNGATAAVFIAQLTGNPALSAADFVVI